MDLEAFSLFVRLIEQVFTVVIKNKYLNRYMNIAFQIRNQGAAVTMQTSAK